MMSEHLTKDELRVRLMDLSFSLYESMGDLLSDMIVLDDPLSPDDMAEVLSKLSVSSMDCLADMELLLPILRSIRLSLVNG